MLQFSARLFGAAVALTLAAGTPTFAQQLELKLMAPAAPGGGWDQTARSMQQALVAAGIARSVPGTAVTVRSSGLREQACASQVSSVPVRATVAIWIR